MKKKEQDKFERRIFIREICLQNNIDLYTQYMRLAPWCSKTRKGWKALIDQATNELQENQTKLTKES